MKTLVEFVARKEMFCCRLRKYDEREKKIYTMKITHQLSLALSTLDHLHHDNANIQVKRRSNASTNYAYRVDDILPHRVYYSPPYTYEFFV